MTEEDLIIKRHYNFERSTYRKTRNSFYKKMKKEDGTNHSLILGGEAFSVWKYGKDNNLLILLHCELLLVFDNFGVLQLIRFWGYRDRL